MHHVRPHPLATPSSFRTEVVERAVPTELQPMVAEKLRELIGELGWKVL